jgi:hypothetical protein
VLLTSYDPVVEPAPIQYKPVLLERSVLENSIRYQSAKEITNPGKIYLYNNYLLINEKYKGLHVLDNINPASPENIGFIQIPGCIDMAVKDNILYADNAVDLVAVDVTDVKNPVVVKRIVNAFPEIKPPGETWIPYQYTPENRPDETIIIEWIEE